MNTLLTPKVQYAYSEMAGGANHSRPITITYPNGRVLNYNYKTGLDDSISRLSSISDSSATLESHFYLGLGTVVKRSHPQPGVDLTYVKQTGESNGDGGDQYTGLDRFARVVDQRWIVTASGTATDRFQYGYDRDRNRLYKNNIVNSSFSELYHANGASNAYDQLNQLAAFSRGVLSDTNSDGVPDTVASASHSQTWSFDALGNWSSFVSDSSTQTRTHNDQNQITSISGQTTPGYDANGNMTGDQTGNGLVFDGWNRLVAYKQGMVILVNYQFDALNRRIIENPGVARTLFYSSSWQVLEEDVAGSASIQYVWSPVYVDAMIERDRIGVERLYVQQDANWNVSAVTDTSGAVQERYIEDPYGQPSVLASDWSSRVSSLFAWNYLHQGGRYDTTSGLYQFRFRDYSSALGEWLNIDPIGYAGKDLNLYRYVQDDPPSLRDPKGLCGTADEPQGGSGQSSSAGETFYVCCQSVGENHPTARACGCQHADIYGDQLGLIYEGWFGPVHGPKVPMPNGKGVKCYKLKLSSGSLNLYPGGMPEPQTLLWGPTGIRGKSCKNATTADILACLRAKPVPAGKAGLVSNCQTDAYAATRGCCLTGFDSPATILPPGPGVVGW